MEIPAARAKEMVLDLLAAGHSRKDAMARVGRSVETYRDWYRSDEWFQERVKSLREAMATGRTDTASVPDFPEFCEKYLRKPLPHHQLRAWDVICGGEPRDMHPAMFFQQGTGAGDYVICNFPPSHGKSTVWTVNYVVWRIHRDPNIRVVIVSKTESMAKKFISQIQFMLTSGVFREMHAAFAPDGGWKPTEKGAGMSWRENMIYVRGRDASEKDPTVQALGIGSQIYGSRADLIILDDIEDYANSGMYDKHGEWISQEVFSRIEDDSDRNGQLLMVGTRVAPMDVYRHLRDNATDWDDEPFYTYFSQPAILENATARWDQWVVLWPQRLDARKIARKRAAFTDARRFELIYQQNDVPDDAPFPAEAVQASINRQRYPGPMYVSQTGHRTAGMHGLYVVAGLDPATVGCTAAVVGGTDKVAAKRWILDAENMRGATPAQTIELIKEFQVKYKVNEWRVERNAFQRFLTQLPEVRDFIHAHGGVLREHQTTAYRTQGGSVGKWDPDWGVETLIPLFLSCVEITGEGRMIPKPDGAGLIELPNANHGGSGAIRELIEQLQIWEPEQSKATPNDLVMALWMMECGIKQYLHGLLTGGHFMAGRFVSKKAKAARTVVSIDDLMIAGELSGAA
jgi:hypothetical protein